MSKNNRLYKNPDYKKLSTIFNVDLDDNDKIYREKTLRNNKVKIYFEPEGAGEKVWIKRECLGEVVECEFEDKKRKK